MVLLCISIALNMLLIYLLWYAHRRIDELYESSQENLKNYASANKKKLELMATVDSLDAKQREQRGRIGEAKQMMQEARLKLPNLLLLLCFLPLIGCSPDVPRVVSVQPPAAEVPTVNLPASLRQENWVSRSNGQGSCVHASSVAHFNWQGKYEKANRWKRTYAGGETAYSILNKWIDNRIPFTYTDNGDPAFLDWATKTRRGAIIWYYPSHCVTFCGFAVVNGRDYAYILDNNRVNRFIAIDKSEFIRSWRGFGGFAATAVFTPAGPIPWPAYVPERS